MDTRRSRMHRARKGKRLALTQRDIEIFRALAQYRYLRSTYLHAFAGGASAKRFMERVGDLFHEGYVDRPQAQWEFASARTSPTVYELGAGGRRALEGLGSTGDEARTFLGTQAHRQFVHSVMICECLASVEVATRACTDLRFISWPEILAKAPEATKRLGAPFRLPSPLGAILPDGLFGLEYRSEDGARKYRFFALEADRGTMPLIRSKPGQTSLVGKLAAYTELFRDGRHRGHLGIPNLLVLAVTTNDQRSRETMRYLAARTDNSVLLFKAVQPHALSAPNPRLLCEAWERPGLDPLPIDR